MTDQKSGNGGNGEGELPYNVGMKVGIERGNIIVLFSESISVLGLPIPAARQLARALYDNCDLAEQMLKEKQQDE